MQLSRSIFLTISSIVLLLCLTWPVWANSPSEQSTQPILQEVQLEEIDQQRLEEAKLMALEIDSWITELSVLQQIRIKKFIPKLNSDSEIVFTLDKSVKTQDIL